MTDNNKEKELPNTLVSDGKIIKGAKEPSLIRKAFHVFMTEALLPLDGHAFNEADKTKTCLFAFGAYYSLMQVLKQPVETSDPQLQVMNDVLSFFAPKRKDGFTSEYVTEFFTEHLGRLLQTKSNAKIARAGGQAAKEFAQHSVHGSDNQQNGTYSLVEIILGATRH